MLVEDLGGVGGRAQDVAIDTDDLFAGEDAGAVGAGVLEHRLDDESPGRVGLDHHAVVRLG